jgi:hypothetical protein
MRLSPRISVCLVLFLLVATGASAQTVYVSGGANIYAVTNGTATVIYTNANANFESLAIGPDNVDTDNAVSPDVGNAAHAFLLYACDPAGNIIRLDPAQFNAADPTKTSFQSVATELGFAPVCGRSTATGDFYVTNESGAGVYQLMAKSNNLVTPVANISFSGSSTGGTVIGATATPIDTFNGMTGRGITQTYVGDLLAVDNAQNKVLRSTYGTPPLFATLSSFITKNLNGPVGVAKAPSLRQVFVSNSNSSKRLPTQPAVSIFDSTGAPAAAPCPSGLALPNNNKQVPDYLASAPTANATNTVINDTIYLVTNSNSAGTLWTWNTAQGNCSLVQAASIGTAVTGVAVAPAPVTLMLPVSTTEANPMPTTFNFNSSLFQLTATGCTASVTAYPLSQATVNSMIHLAKVPGGDTNASPPYPVAPPPLLDSAVQAPGLGDAGFEIAYVAHWFFPGTAPPAPSSCTSVFTDGGFITGVFNFIDPAQFTNPRVVQCDNSDPTTEPQLFPPNVTTTCGVPATVGVYPLSGPIAGDSGVRTNSVFAMVNENSGAGTSEPGQFCGFQPPLSNAQPPALAGSFSALGSTTVNVKFKISTPSGNCKKDFISDAVALISVAKVCNTAPSNDPLCGPNGSPTFSAINVEPTSSSLDQPPIFNGGNNQYSFTLNLPSIFAQGGAGTYSLTVTFLSDNTKSQTILFGLTQ